VICSPLLYTQPPDSGIILLFTKCQGTGFLPIAGTSYYASSITLAAPGPPNPYKVPHGLNLLVSSDGGLLRISPRVRVALQDAHVRSGVRLIARNRSGRRDESGAPMAVIPEG
jgi:hypothetical protein